MAAEEREQIGLPFELGDYYSDFYVIVKVNELINAEQLPFDTLFRLAAVGYKTVDDTHTFLNYALMLDMLRHADNPDKMRAETQEVLWGEMPNAIVDVNSHYNYPAYAMLEPLYYRKRDLVDAIQKRRAASGQTLDEAPYDRRLHTRTQDELSRCRSIARPLWSLMVKRFHPEWLETPGDYYPSRYIGTFAVVYDISEPRQRYGIVNHAVFSDPLVMSIYEEATTTGVRGIGRVGIEDLRILLSEEHPELLEGHELPASE